MRAAREPAPRGVLAAVRSAFMTGIHRGSLAAAGTTLAAALLALDFVPARAAAEPTSTPAGLPAGPAAVEGLAAVAERRPGVASAPNAADGRAAVARCRSAEAGSRA